MVIHRSARIALFSAIVLICFSGLVSPPIALAIGLVFAFAVGHPFPDLSTKITRFLLQLSIIGLGFGMNLADVWSAGKTGFWFTLGTIAMTMVMGWLLGRVLRVESQSSWLVSTGTAVCGGSAIAAVGVALKADHKAISVSLVTVFILNSIALFVFPPLGKFLHLSQQQFGLWAAIAIHDTSSVVGAAAKYGEIALQIATIVKLTRALWIVPIVVGISLLTRQKASSASFPWFILAFVLAAAIRTVLPQGENAYFVIKNAARIGLTLTLFLIGAGLSRDAIRLVGARALIQGIILWAVVSLMGLLAVWEIA